MPPVLANRDQLVQVFLNLIKNAAEAIGPETGAFVRTLASFSRVKEEGPRLAIEELEKNGIAVVIERHLPRTHLDGAAMKLSDGTPVIGLTLSARPAR